MPRIYEYDPRSLVVDPSQAVGEILGAFQKKRDAEQVNELQAQLAKTPLDDPEFQKVLMRMRQVDPEAAAAAAEMALFQDQRQTAARDKELKQWSGINMAIASAPDKASRDAIIRQQISDWQQAGRDVSDLEDMLGLDADRQLLRAKTNLHMIGESELLNQIAGTSMLDQLKIQGELLGMQKTQQEIRLAEQRAARDEAAAQRAEEASARAAAEEQRKAEKAGRETEAADTQARLAREEMSRALEIARRLASPKLADARAAATGTVSTIMPTFKQDTAAFEDDVSTLNSLLTMGNLGRMTGVLSESDIALLRQAAGGLTLRSQSRLERGLAQIIGRLSAKMGDADAKTSERQKQQANAWKGDESKRQEMLERAKARYVNR